MSTVGKALSLLDVFDHATPEFGLSDIARVAGFDKATTRRLLVALAGGGFIEQDTATRRYRLGPAFVRLARLREASFPLLSVARPVAEALSQEVGETVHISELAGDVLATVHVCDSPHAHRIAVEVGERLPFNCSAAGIAVLAFGSDALRKRVFTRPLVGMTPYSATDAGDLAARADMARGAGYAINSEGFEAGVVSVAAPLFGSRGDAIGAISIASPTARVDFEAAVRQAERVKRSAAHISTALGGRRERWPRAPSQNKPT